MRALIAGCGYLGTAVGSLLVKAGHEVVGLRRTEDASDELRRFGIIPVNGDLTDLRSLESIPGKFDWVVNTVSSSRGGADVYRAVYLEGTRTLLEWLRGHPLKRYVYTSSTSVYGQTDGSTVDEDSVAQPATETGAILRATEDLLVQAAHEGVPTTILRVSGIYGPERGHLFRQFVNGEARISGEGHRWMNMVHRDDVAKAILVALEKGQNGRIYNCTDDVAVTQLEFLGWLAQQFDRTLPPPATEEAATRKKRGITHKQVSNLRLKRELDWNPIYPSFREGYAEDVNHILRTWNDHRPGKPTVEVQPT